MKNFLLLFALMVALQSYAQNELPVNYLNFTSQQEPLMMAYVYEKPAVSNGKTILLLHGKNFSHLYWKEVIEALVAKGYSVLAPDQIGFGMSSMPFCYQYSFQQLAENTHKLVASLGIKKAIILGNSMGGMLAIRYALTYPSECMQLILEDPIGLEDWKLKVPYSTIDEEYKANLKMTDSALKKYMLENYFHHEWKPQYNKLLKQSSKDLNDSSFAWSMAQTSDMIFTQPVCYEFADLKVPTVLIVGTLDKTAIGKEKLNAKAAATMGNYPVLGKKAAALIPGCRLIELNGIGHLPHIENFTLFMQTLMDVLH